MKSGTDLSLLQNTRDIALAYQVTFRTPLTQLERFAAEVMELLGNHHAGRFIIFSYVFEPERIASQLKDYGVGMEISDGVWIETENRKETEEVFVSILRDWIDFAFIPIVGQVTIYADHDEFCTFYTETKSTLERTVSRLSNSGFKQIAAWERKL